MSILEFDVTNISLVLNVAGFLVLLWQFVESRKLKKYMRSEAMEAYWVTGILLGHAQACQGQLKAGNNNLVIQETGEVEGMAQALFARSIKNIHHHFNYTRKDVDDWIENAKIVAHHRNDFLRYAEK